METHGEPCVLALDPGREKMGIAIVNYNGALLQRAIIATDQLAEELEKYIETYPHMDTLVCGDGTNHKVIFFTVEQIAKHYGLTAVLVDERHTTEEGRRRYWKANPPPWWKRWIPLSMQYPPEPVDDFTAWVIGERYLQSK